MRVRQTVFLLASAMTVVAAGIAVTDWPRLLVVYRDAVKQRTFVDTTMNEQAQFLVKFPNVLRQDLYTGEPITWPSEDSFVVMVGTKECRYCGAAWEKWLKSKVTGRADRKESNAWFVAMNQEVMQRAASQAVELSIPIKAMPTTPDRVLQVRTPFTYVSMTGVVAVPTTFVVSAKRHAACVVSGVPSEQQVATCESLVDSDRTEFFWNGASRERLVRMVDQKSL